MKRRKIGSLTAADFGLWIHTGDGGACGHLWSVQHVNALGDIPEAYTNVVLVGATTTSPPALPPETLVIVEKNPDCCRGYGRPGRLCVTQSAAGES